MSLTLAPRDTALDIDSDLDRFNDALGILGYEANARQATWGETVIEIYVDDAEPIKEFWSGTPGDFDLFRSYTDDLIDSTSVPRSEMQEAMGL